MMEIGSEFHKAQTESGKGFIPPVDGTFVFSGRTAIETVLKELPYAKKAALPSYCCDSMIEPFRRAGYQLEFYSVNYFDKLVIDVQISKDVDVLLWCNYFGFHITMPDFSEFKKRGGVIIEDVTHSLLSESFCNLQSDYLVASVRKWFPINCGGYCALVNGTLRFKPTQMPSQEFIDNKSLAMRLKAEYLDDLDEQKKEQFLSIFGNSNHWLAENYSELDIDFGSKDFLGCVDVIEQRHRRRRNTHILYEGLKNKVEFMFSEEDMDCPLFVPVLLSDRNETRKILTENKIYCPVHWPKPIDCNSNLYDMELSLICDQRYGEEEMIKIISVLERSI